MPWLRSFVAMTMKLRSITKFRCLIHSSVISMQAFKNKRLGYFYGVGTVSAITLS